MQLGRRLAPVHYFTLGGGVVPPLKGAWVTS
jgi:hypothetical protein